MQFLHIPGWMVPVLLGTKVLGATILKRRKYLRGVQVSGEHDDREGQYIGSVRTCKYLQAKHK